MGYYDIVYTTQYEPTSWTGYWLSNEYGTDVTARNKVIGDNDEDDYPGADYWKCTYPVMNLPSKFDSIQLIEIY